MKITLKVTAGLSELIKKSDNIILKSSGENLIVNGVKDLYYITILDKEEFASDTNDVSVVFKRHELLKLVETDDTITVEDAKISVGNNYNKFSEVKIIGIDIKQYTGTIYDKMATKSVDNKVLHKCLRAVDNDLPTGIDYVRFIDHNVYISSAYFMLVIKNYDTLNMNNITIPYKILKTNISDGQLNIDEEYVYFLGTKMSTVMPKYDNSSVRLPVVKEVEVLNNVSFIEINNKIIFNIINTRFVTNTKLYISNHKISLFMNSDNVVIGAPDDYDYIINLYPFYVDLLLSLFYGFKFNIVIGEDNIVLYVEPSENIKQQVILYIPATVTKRSTDGNSINA